MFLLFSHRCVASLLICVLVIDIVAESAPVVSGVTPSVVYTLIPTTITVTGRGFVPAVSGAGPVCKISSQDTVFVGANYTDDPTAQGYNILRALPANIINDTHLTCHTVPVHNAAPATISVSIDGSQWSNATSAPRMYFVPFLEWAVGRRPYVYENKGEVILRTHHTVAGAKLTLSAILHEHSLNGTAYNSAIDPRIANGGNLFGIPRKLVAAGAHRIAFSLDGLPSHIYGDLLLETSYEFPSGARGSFRSWKRFVRVPAPKDNRTVFQVDHPNPNPP